MRKMPLLGGSNIHIVFQMVLLLPSSRTYGKTSWRIIWECHHPDHLITLIMKSLYSCQEIFPHCQFLVLYTCLNVCLVPSAQPSH
uniref:Putative ovule protein n=1 Tax=Solanum chacoense TaxID=4108 RepID=A0A0V0J0D5_SOLCH